MCPLMIKVCSFLVVVFVYNTESASSEEDFDWSFMQSLPEENADVDMEKKIHYGFNDFATDFFETAENSLGYGKVGSHPNFSGR